MWTFSRLFICLSFDLFILYPLRSTCFRLSVPCLLCVVHTWMCLCYILKHVYTLCISFGTVALSDLCHFMPLLSSHMLPLCCFDCRCLCMVLIVLKASLVSVSLNIPWPKNVHVIHLFCWYIFSLAWSWFVIMWFLFKFSLMDLSISY
jgi:hypothetical protein